MAKGMRRVLPGHEDSCILNRSLMDGSRKQPRYRSERMSVWFGVQMETRVVLGLVNPAIIPILPPPATRGFGVRSCARACSLWSFRRNSQLSLEPHGPVLTRSVVW